MHLSGENAQKSQDTQDAEPDAVDDKDQRRHDLVEKVGNTRGAQGHGFRKMHADRFRRHFGKNQQRDEHDQVGPEDSVGTPVPARGRRRQVGGEEDESVDHDHLAAEQSLRATKQLFDERSGRMSPLR